MIRVKISLLTAGYCTHPEWVTLRGGSLGIVRFPAIFALLEHPTLGLILFDTGYARHFAAATRSLPNKLYRWVTPVALNEGESAAAQLLQKGIDPLRLERVIVSHFHADHIAGLRDFPHAAVLCSEQAYRTALRLRGLAAVRVGFLPELLPDGFAERCRRFGERERVALPEAFAPFSHGYDVLGDGSLLAVDLPGHASGQIGLLLTDEAGVVHFLCADACWSSRAYRENRLPHPAASLAMDDASAYRDSFGKVRRLWERRPDIRIIPSHCREIAAALQTEEGRIWKP